MLIVALLVMGSHEDILLTASAALWVEGVQPGVRLVFRQEVRLMMVVLQRRQDILRLVPLFILIFVPDIFIPLFSPNLAVKLRPVAQAGLLGQLRSGRPAALVAKALSLHLFPLPPLLLLPQLLLLLLPSPLLLRFVVVPLFLLFTALIIAASSFILEDASATTCAVAPGAHLKVQREVDAFSRTLLVRIVPLADTSHGVVIKLSLQPLIV
mmetsp:Transcript_13022/g.25872  ORF Transcript_13022/g.25872 Transcript_13022/m.25872 type:complete len:211 (-) Transcript_13022:221-853(-)